MKNVRIFISSPADVKKERVMAYSVVNQLNEEFKEQLVITPVLWENLPLDANSSFQDGIDLFTSNDNGIDIAVFILRSRLGSKINKFRENGEQYESGTLYEFDTAIQSSQSNFDHKPIVLVYKGKSDVCNAILSVEQRDTEIIKKLIKEQEELEKFFESYFYDPNNECNVRAFHEFVATSEFGAKLKEHLRLLLRNMLPENVTESWLWKGCPFKGLKAFDFEDEAIFFGREKSINEIIEKLNYQSTAHKPFVLVVGQSGCGKSSIIRAGVLPRIILSGQFDNIIYRWAAFVPGQSGGNLCDGLWEALTQSTALSELEDNFNLLERFRKNFDAHPEGILWIIEDLLKDLSKNVEKNQEFRLLLFIDQFEEIFTHDFSKESQNSFFNILIALAESKKVWIIASIRSDFYSYFQENKLLKLRGKYGLYDLLSPTSAELRDIITEPARNAGLKYEKNILREGSLDNQILKDVRDNPQILPLLEFALTELYDYRSDDNVMTYEAYDNLGGIQGALAISAEKSYLELSSEQQKAFPSFISSLVGLSPDKKPVKKQAPCDDAIKNEVHRSILKHFIEARLVVVDKDETDKPFVSFVHEAIIDHWERVKDWINENKRFLDNESFIQGLTFQWKKNNKKKSYLISEIDQLYLAENLEKNWYEHLETDPKTFISESRKNFLQKDLIYWVWLALISGIIIILSLFIPSILDFIQVSSGNLLMISSGLFFPSVWLTTLKLLNKPYFKTIVVERAFWLVMSIVSMILILMFAKGLLKDISFLTFALFLVPYTMTSLLKFVSKQYKYILINYGGEVQMSENWGKASTFLRWVDNKLLGRFYILVIFLMSVGSVSSDNMQKEAKNKAVKSLLSSNVQTFSKLLDATAELIENALYQQTNLVKFELNNSTENSDTTNFSIYKTNDILERYFEKDIKDEIKEKVRNELVGLNMLHANHKLVYRSDFFRVINKDSILEPICFDELLFKIPDNKIEPKQEFEFKKLNHLLDVFKDIRNQGSNDSIFLLQYFGLKENGLFCTYPWHLLEDNKYDPRKREWYIEIPEVNWKFYQFSSTQQLGFTCSMGFKYQGNKSGVSAIDLSLHKIVTKLLPSFVWDNHIGVLLVDVRNNGFVPVWCNDKNLMDKDISYSSFNLYSKKVRDLIRKKSGNVLDCKITVDGINSDCSICHNKRLDLLCIYIFNNR